MQSPEPVLLCTSHWDHWQKLELSKSFIVVAAACDCSLQQSHQLKAGSFRDILISHTGSAFSSACVSKFKISNSRNAVRLTRRFKIALHNFVLAPWSIKRYTETVFTAAWIPSARISRPHTGHLLKLQVRALPKCLVALLHA